MDYDNCWWKIKRINDYKLINKIHKNLKLFAIDVSLNFELSTIIIVIIYLKLATLIINSYYGQPKLHFSNGNSTFNGKLCKCSPTKRQVPKTNVSHAVNWKGHGTWRVHWWLARIIAWKSKWRNSCGHVAYLNLYTCCHSLPRRKYF